MRREGIVYLIGIAAFGLSYYPLRAALANDMLFFLMALVYLALLRLIGRLWEGRGRDADKK